MVSAGRLLASAALLGCFAQAASAEPATVIYASSDPSVSVSSAPYTSLQESAGLVKREAGVSLKVQATAGATAAAQAISAGNAFYNWGGMSSLIVAAQKDPSLVIISADPGNFFRIVVPEGSAVRAVADLKGKAIGTQSFGSAAYLFGRAVVQRAGLDPQKDVKWIAVGVGAQAASALRGGAVAAYAGYDSTDAVIGNLLKDPLRELDSPLNDLVGMTGIIVRREAVEKQPELVGGLCRAVYEGFVFAKANPRETVLNHWRVYPDQKPSSIAMDQALAEAEAMLIKRVSYIAMPGADGLYGHEPIEALQRTADELLAAGMLEQRADMAALADFRFKERCGRLDAAAIAREAQAWHAPQN